ncbi:asparagine synthetase B, partial [Candidatus Roizmanbacteria bacterium]|nr:asparagine synthetase B [Candidatus Roizmanbacteria bacterium]
KTVVVDTTPPSIDSFSILQCEHSLRVGTCLSGGLDSSTIVSVVNKLLQDNVMEAKSVGSIQKTFSAVFPGGANDEEKYIDEVTKNLKLKIKNFKTYPKPEEFFKDIEEFIRVQEEPTISTGPYAQFKVMQLAHKKVTVLLDGQGADEMMAGYDPYLFVYLRQLWKEKKYVIFLKELFSSMDIIGKYVIRNLTGANSNVSIHWMKESFLKKFKNEEFSNVKDNLKKRLIEDIFGNSLQALLRYEDRNSMSFSIEGRVPFLDSNLLRYLFSLPDEAIVKNGWNKFILRQTMKDLLPELIVKRRNKIGFTTPEYEWFLRMKNKIYSIFLSESFAKRKYFNQQEVLKAFQLFIEGKTDDTMLFWRFLNTELWLRIFFDPQPVNRFTNSRIHEFGKPNEGKKLEIKIDEKRYLRFPIRTELFKKGDEVTKKIAELLYSRIAKNNITIKQYNSKKWFIVVSEKIVALAQGRSYFIWDIKAGFWSKLLARFVKKTPNGIGLGSQWTMELAIREVGVVRVISAAIIAAITKPFGWSGLFYRIAGEEVASIDGPTEYSLYPSNVSAKLGPKDPQRVAENIKLQITNTKSISNFKFQILNFMGVVIIDANDLGQKVLGNSTGLDNKLIEKIFSDNPMGQADEQTPLALVSELK